MYNKVFKFILVISIMSLVGCASELTSTEKKQYSYWEKDGDLIHEKSPGLAVALGILPGGGSYSSLAA